MTFRDAWHIQNGWIFGKIYIADFCHYRRYLGHEFRKTNCNMIFRKWGGGQRPFGTFPKIHPFWMCKASLRNKDHKYLLAMVPWDFKIYKMLKSLYGCILLKKCTNPNFPKLLNFSPGCIPMARLMIFFHLPWTQFSKQAHRNPEL